MQAALQAPGRVLTMHACISKPRTGKLHFRIRPDWE